MTYITPDFVALEQEAKRYAAHHRLPQGPAFIGGRGFRGEVIPLLAAAPVPPLTMAITRSWKTTNPAPSAAMVTTSPFDQDHQDPLPGMFLSTAAPPAAAPAAAVPVEEPAPPAPASSKGLMVGAAVLGVAYWFLKRR